MGSTDVQALARLIDGLARPAGISSALAFHDRCPMKAETLSALVALSEALGRHPDDLRTLQHYGNLPDLILDVLEDWIPDDLAA